MKTIAALLALAAFMPVARAQSTIDPASPYAWGANIGWTNWQPSAAGGVVVGEYVCSGTIYCANVGWVNMGVGSPVDGIRYANATADDFGVNVLASNTPGIAVLRGSAYGANIGWINFAQTGNPQIDLTNGQLSGYAWSANCGWLNLGTATPYGVTSSTIAAAADTDLDGIADAFEYENFGDLTTATAISDTDGDGMSDLAEALADTDPLDPADSLRILSIALAQSPTTDTATLTFTSGTTRLYRIEQRSDLAAGAWLDSGLGLFIGDGAATTREISTSTNPRRFYRVAATRPLAP